MAELTDADQKSFIDKIVGALTANSALLKSKDWDPTQRITNLKNGQTTVTNDEGVISQLEQALTSAIAMRRTDLDNNYGLASASIGGAENALGKDHPLVGDLHKIRGAMSHASPAAKPAAP